MQYRLEQSRDCLSDAKRDASAQSYKAAANRSYYCIFHAMRAVLAKDGFDSQENNDVIKEFNKGYIKTGVFPTDFLSIIQNSSATEKRINEEGTEITKDDILKQIVDTKIFYNAVEKYIVGLLKKNNYLDEFGKANANIFMKKDAVIIHSSDIFDNMKKEKLIPEDFKFEQIIVQK